jgi:hypothetical protein
MVGFLEALTIENVALALDYLHIRTLDHLGCNFESKANFLEFLAPIKIPSCQPVWALPY